jgi:hypothetical protein
VTDQNGLAYSAGYAEAAEISPAGTLEDSIGPEVSGEPLVGETLVCQPGSWNADVEKLRLQQPPVAQQHIQRRQILRQPLHLARQHLVPRRLDLPESRSMNTLLDQKNTHLQGTFS